ncbi:hypothetical protein [Streptomyces sp. WMMB 322]|uniref:SCO2584 family spore wall biosynthesis protein n=1 Tax=Streptomyces sp. WMMB 322 TaxID=1286821 RepID=UPI0006E2612F|nr:hypothetical protein [Streptomyces sp. WMMB 322]SCK17847.1 hypothetical protein H180DRAFT_01214 [Streptomyces sp. WMMB 322]
MPDDVGGQPFPDGEEPEYRYGAADEEFAALVLDEDFVRSAAIHEPTAAERILAAAQSHAESETVRGFEDGYAYGPGAEGDFGFDEDDPDGTGDPDGPAGVGDLDDPDDDEGRFDRSDYTEYLDPADGDEYDHYGPHEPYAPYGYNPNSFGDSGHYAPYQYGRFVDFGQHDQYGQYIRFGVNRRYDPRFDLGEEHGSDHRRPGRGKHGAAPRGRPYRGHMRWQRPVAWLLALVMGIGMVALALGAVYRGTSQQRQDPSPPPATTGVGSSAKEHEGTQRTPDIPAQSRPG